MQSSFTYDAYDDYLLLYVLIYNTCLVFQLKYHYKLTWIFFSQNKISVIEFLYLVEGEGVHTAQSVQIGNKLMFKHSRIDQGEGYLIVKIFENC